jgi:hypothetical protein
MRNVRDLSINGKNSSDPSMLKSGQHDRNPVTTKHENSRELGDNGHAAGNDKRAYQSAIEWIE